MHESHALTSSARPTGSRYASPSLGRINLPEYMTEMAYSKSGFHSLRLSRGS